MKPATWKNQRIEPCLNAHPGPAAPPIGTQQTAKYPHLWPGRAGQVISIKRRERAIHMVMDGGGSDSWGVKLVSGVGGGRVGVACHSRGSGTALRYPPNRPRALLTHLLARTHVYTPACRSTHAHAHLFLPVNDC